MQDSTISEYKLIVIYLEKSVEMRFTYTKNHTMSLPSILRICLNSPVIDKLEASI